MSTVNLPSVSAADLAPLLEGPLTDPALESRALHPASGDVVRRLGAGDPVEVQNRFDGGWCHGFEIADVLVGAGRRQYRIRRLSDGVVLPRLFEEETVSPRG